MTAIMVLVGMILFVWLFGWAVQLLENPPVMQIPQPRYEFPAAPAPAQTSFPARTN